MDNAYTWSAQRFKRIMEQKGMTCEMVAERLVNEKRWISTPLFVYLQVRGFAKDRHPMDLHHIHQIAEVLDVPLFDLLEKENYTSKISKDR